MNLINDPWIPVIRQSGGYCRIAPWQIAEPDDPVVELAADRADFQGALYQFLIGLLQTCVAPVDGETWAEWYESPPSPQQLSRSFELLIPVFALTNEIGQPAFMQDLTLEEAEQKDIAALLMEAPGSQTLRNNLDFFVKGGQVNAICPACAAQALFTLQTNAPSGGAGHRVGLRGGGPLTTLLQPVGPSTLWQKLWLNVLDSSARLNSADSVIDAAVFPWLGPTRISDKTGQSTLPGDVHPLQMYWGMPRRIRLQPTERNGCCDLCGEPAEALFSHYVTRNYGTNYEGAWLHPLTPYRIDAKNEAPPLSLKGQKGGLGYRHWLGLVLGDEDNGNRPATVVSALLEDKEIWLDSGRQLQLWCFGYDMDNMKARCWYDQVLPVFALPGQRVIKVQEWARQLLSAARDTAPLLRQYIKEAWYRSPKNATGDFSFIDSEFWSVTEPAFYRQLQALVEASETEDRAPAEIYKQWFKALNTAVDKLFSQFALQTRVEDLDLKRVMTARQHLLGRFHKLKSIKLLKDKGLLAKEATHG